MENKPKQISQAELNKRWSVKKNQIQTLSNNIQSLRLNLTKDLKSDNEKVFLTALVISLMDKTAERVGNDESANNGHYGITGLEKKHIKINGDKIYLKYVGKSGVEHEKEFTDSKLADALKKAIANSSNHNVFTTSNGFNVNAAKVNRYLKDFNVRAKDIRGYSANKWVIEKLRSKDIPKEEKDRKKIFSEVLKSVSEKIGHSKSMLKNQYLIPELEKNYIEMGKIIDVANKESYEKGGSAIGWKHKKTNVIVGNNSNPTKMESGQVIINKKATKQNLDRLIDINNDGLNKPTKKEITTDGTDGGLLKGKPHYDKNGKPLGGIPVIVDGGKNIEVEGNEFVVNKEASQKHWKELSKINQSAGNGVPIEPSSVNVDEDPDEFKEGGKIIDFNPNHLPRKEIYNYAKKIKNDYPKVWDLGGNIFGNEAFKNLERVLKRGYWTDNEEWMYIKWRSYVARHKQDFRIAGVIAMLKWVDKVDKGWAYMKDLIEDEIEKKYPKKKGGGAVTYKQKYNKKYGYDLDETHDLSEVAKDTGVSEKGLQQIYNKGIGAYKTNPESVRPNVKSKEQWAMGRVYSAVMGGKAARVDSNELKMEQGGSLEDFDWESLYNPSPEEQKIRDEEYKKSLEQEKEDWYQGTKFSKKWAETYQDAVNKTVKEYLDAKATYEDWGSRQYKQNKGTVFLGGDDIFGEAKSIGSINEGRRQRVMRGAKMQMDEAIETLKELRLSDEEISNLLENKMALGGNVINNSCIEELLNLINSHSEIHYWVIDKNTNNLVIVFKDEMGVYDIDVYNEFLNSFTECKNVFEKEVEIQYDNDNYKTIFIKLKTNDIDVLEMKDGGNIECNRCYKDGGNIESHEDLESRIMNQQFGI